MGQLRMVPMASLPPFQAQVLVAHLGAEGILWQLRGESSVYPFALVDVLVEEDEVQRARELLDQAGPEPEDDATAPSPADPSNTGTGRRTPALWVWLVIIAVLLGLALRLSHLG